MSTNGDEHAASKNSKEAPTPTANGIIKSPKKPPAAVAAKKAQIAQQRSKPAQRI